VVDVAIMRDKHNGRSRGFSFVTFRERTKRGTEILIQRLFRPSEPHKIQGRTIDIREGDGSKPPDSFLERQKNNKGVGDDNSYRNENSNKRLH